MCLAGNRVEPCFLGEIAENIPEDCPVVMVLGKKTQRFTEKHKVIFEVKGRNESRFLDSRDWTAKRFSRSISA